MITLTEEERKVLDGLAERSGLREWTLICNNGLVYEVVSSFEDELSMYVIRDVLYSMVQLIDKNYPLDNLTIN